jgi:serine/threonine-protein kinase
VTVAPAHVGDILAGKYCIERVLGQGGMGVVVAARHLRLRERVAVKLLAPHLGARGDVVARFVAEGRAAMRIRSEHVVRVYDVGTLATGEPYLVMEYLEGRDLAAALEQGGPLPVEAAVEYVLQAIEAIAEAHALGIVHRDIKPSNLFLTRRTDGSPMVKVLDFGIAKSTHSGPEASLTSSGTLGTPVYMAPEQMRSARSVGASADVWALGVTLYALLTGAPPFLAGSVVEIHERILRGAPRLRATRPDAPAALEAILLRCMQPEPADRYTDVAELAEALAELAPARARISAERAARVLGAPRPADAPTEPLGSEGARGAGGPSAKDAGDTETAAGPSWIDAEATARLTGASLPSATSARARRRAASRRSMAMAVLGAYELVAGVHDVKVGEGRLQAAAGYGALAGAGAGADTSGSDPVGYVRSDGVSAVVRRARDNHVRELWRGRSGWNSEDLTALAGAPAAAGRPFASRRGDGVSAIVFRSVGGHVIELSSPTGSGWKDVTLEAGAPDAAGDPFGYVRDDGVDAVVFRSRHDRVIELDRIGSGWSAEDLTTLTGAPGAARDPAAYVRSDRASTVVFRSLDNRIVELERTSGRWRKNDLSASTGAPAALGDPFGYVRHDGTNSIVFRGWANDVWELTLTSFWESFRLSNFLRPFCPAVRNLSAHIRSDRIDSVLFRCADDHVREMWFDTGVWHADDPSAEAGAPPAAGDPSGYVRADGVDAIVFRTAAEHIVELARLPSGWATEDLSAASGESPASWEPSSRRTTP